MDIEAIASIRNIDQRIEALAAPNGGIVANWLLRAGRVSRAMVARRVDDGFLRRLTSQEFAVGLVARGTLDDRARRGLAILHAGPQLALLARGTAACQLGFLDRGDTTIHVVAKGRVRDLPEFHIEYHRNGSLSSSDRIMVAGEPTTTPSLTLADLGFDHSRYQVARAMCAARDRGRLHESEVTDLLHRRFGCPGSREVRAALELVAEGCNGTRGRGEDRLLDGVLASRSLPVPDVCNRRRLGIAGIEPDLAWHDVGLLVFADGRPHTWEDVREKDRQELATLTDRGKVVLRFDNHSIWNRLRSVVAEIEEAHEALRSGRSLALARR